MTEADPATLSDGPLRSEPQRVIKIASRKAYRSTFDARTRGLTALGQRAGRAGRAPATAGARTETRRFDMKVLLGVDGSTSADRAASLVANLAWPAGSTIEVVTAYPGTAALFEMPGVVMGADVIQETEDAMEAEARRMVTDVARQFAAPDLTVETQILRERAATALLHQASDFRADLVVVGNRGRGPFESAVLGSVSAEMVDHSRLPVLVARRDHIDRILLGEDGSESAAAAADIVRRWSVLHGARVRVLSVADVDPQWNPWLGGAALREAHAAASAKLHEHHEALARETAARLRKAGLQTEGGAEDGEPGASAR